MVREYHALRVNLTPAQVDALESNHRNLSAYIGTLRDQLSEGRLAVATATSGSSNADEPLHPSVSGTVSNYVAGVLRTIKTEADPSLEKVRYPWSKARARGSYAVAQEAAMAEAQALASLAAARASASGASTAPVAESRRKRRRRKNMASSREQVKILDDHTMEEGVPQTDLAQTYRDVNRNRSMLQDATQRFKPSQRVAKAPLGRPSTAPPPKSPFGTLKLLQHVLTYDLTAYKRLPPRELGPGHYDTSAALPPPVKDPHRMSASFLSPTGRPSAGHSGGGGDSGSGDDGDAQQVGAEFGAPSTFSGRQKAISRILKDQGVSGVDRKPSPYDRLYKGERPPKSKRSLALQSRRGHPLGGSGYGSSSAPNLLSKIGTSLWDDAFYNDIGEGSKSSSSNNSSSSPRRLAPLSPTRGGAPGAYGGAYLPYDKMDTFMRPTSPEFKFPAAKRFIAEKEPHWKGLGSPYNMQKDLACWLNESVYLDERLPRDASASKRLADREEGPQPLSASFNSVAGNIKGSPITYKPSFDRSLPRFAKDPQITRALETADRPLGGSEAEERWAAAQRANSFDPNRPSLAFITEGHPSPEDMSLVITMGSQFDEKKPRFRASRALKAELGVLYGSAQDDATVNRGEDGRGGMKRSTSSASASSPHSRRKIPRSFVPAKSVKNNLLKAKKSKKKKATTLIKGKEKQMASTVRPSTTIAGTKSTGGLRATV